MNDKILKAVEALRKEITLLGWGNAVNPNQLGAIECLGIAIRGEGVDRAPSLAEVLDEHGSNQSVSMAEISESLGTISESLKRLADHFAPEK